MASRQTIRFQALAEWMETEGVSFRALQLKSGVDKMTLNRLVNGTLKRFTPSLITGISRATGGRIGEPEFTAYFSELSAAKPKRRAA